MPRDGSAPRIDGDLSARMIGRTIDRYRIVGRLGKGGMGTVWKARDERLGRTVALKLLSEDLAVSPPARRRFEREARMASLLDHPAIAAVHDSGEYQGQLYIVSALVEGCMLRDTLRPGPLAVGEAVRIARTVAEALQHAHERDVIHRDISTANIMLGRDGRVTVIDFGLGRMRKGGSSRLTPTGATWGTGPYIAPEVISNHEAGHRADLYSLGVVLYEMLTGSTPFEAAAFEAVMNRILNETPEPPSRLRPGVPAKLDRIVLKAMAKEPARRHASASALARELDALGLAPSADGAAAPATPARRSTGRGTRKAIDSVRLRCVAVLPFRDESPRRRAANQMFARGLAETVSARLARVPGVQVIPPFALPAKPSADVVALEREVGANFVLSGSVQRTGTRLRVRFSLVGPQRRQIAGDTIDGSARDVLEIEDMLVRRIAHTLELETAALPVPDLVDGTDPAAHEHYLQALGYLQRYENEASVDGAIHLLEKLARTQESDARVQAALGRAYLAKLMLTYESDWGERASAACRKALALDSDLPEALTVLGHIHREKGRYEEAVSDYRRALSMRPDEPDVLCHLAWAYQRCGAIDKAEQALRSALALRPSHWSTHNMLGVLLFQDARYEEAAGEWRRVIELSPDNARGYYNLGAAYYHLGRMGEAIRAYERSIEIRPDASAYQGLGTVRFYLGEREAAVSAFEKGKNLRPSDPRVWGNLADAYRWAPGQEDKARAAYDQAIALRREQLAANRKHGRHWAELASWLAKRGKIAEARRALLRALALMPGDLTCRMHAIRVHHLAGDREETLRSLKSAVEQGCDVTELKRDPELTELRLDPAFARIVEGGRS